MIINKVLYIIAGANGSGKTTLASELLPAETLEFLNADEIAKQLNPEDISKVRITAGKELVNKLNQFISKGKGIAVETTLSGSNHIKTIKLAKDNGYQVFLIYIYAGDAKVCIERIKTRVLRGGHHIPDVDVIRRHSRGIKNFFNIYKNLADEWAIYYNGINEYSRVVKGIKDNAIEISNEILYNYILKESKI